MTHQSTILIVDDEPSARETLEALLFREGYRLVCAANGAEALQKAAELMPDLILLDVMLPGMDGFEVCRRLRADPRLAEAPVIMVTALDDRDSRLQGIEAGADDFISKPFDRAELRARARSITRLNRYRRLLLERAKFEWVVEQADDGYLLLDESDRILYANPRARLYLGLPAAPGEEGAPADATFLALARRQYRCEPQELWTAWPSLPAAPVTRYLVRPQTASSGEFWLQVDLAQMQAPDGAIYALRLRDITADVRAQVNMWTFHGLIHHKLRTPLSILTGFLDILAEDVEGVLDEEKFMYLQSAQDSARNLRNQVLEILEYAGAPTPFDLGTEYCRLADLPALIAQIGERLNIASLAVSHEGLADGDVCAPLPRQALELILGEILENAQKFHPRRSPTVEVKLALAAQSLCIQIGDDGVNLAPDQLLRIWLPYYQAESGFSGALPGMGLGLATVARLIWGIGGTCRAYNRPDGPGIVVELRLPMEEPHAALTVS